MIEGGMQRYVFLAGVDDSELSRCYDAPRERRVFIGSQTPPKQHRRWAVRAGSHAEQTALSSSARAS